MPWTLLITILKDLLTLCFADTSIPEAERHVRARKAVKNPSPVQQWQYERKVREKLDIGIKEWRHQREAILGTLYEDLAVLPDAEVDALIADAKAVDWTI